MLSLQPYSMLLWLTCLILLSGCAGSTVVDFKVKLDVNYTDMTQQHLSDNPAQISVSDRAPTRLNPYPLLHYRDHMLSWYINVDSYSIMFYFLENRSALPLTIYWEQGQVASSQHPEPRPLHAFVRSFSMPEHRFGPLAPQPLAPGVEAFAHFNIAYNDMLFPSHRLFDAQFTSGKTRLDKTGVGEWLRLTLPIEIGDERLQMQIQLTAEDASARISYF